MHLTFEFDLLIKCSPLDLTKVRLQASGDKRMIESLKKTVRTAGEFRLYASSIVVSRFKGVGGLFDGITGTWLRQMSYSLCRFWAYDESKKILGAGKDAPAWRLVAAGGMGKQTASFRDAYTHALQLEVSQGSLGTQEVCVLLFPIAIIC